MPIKTSLRQTFSNAQTLTHTRLAKDVISLADLSTLHLSERRRLMWQSAGSLRLNCGHHMPIVLTWYLTYCSKSNTKSGQNFCSSLTLPTPSIMYFRASLKASLWRVKHNFVKHSYHSQLSKLNLENKTAINGQRI